MVGAYLMNNQGNCKNMNTVTVYCVVVRAEQNSESESEYFVVAESISAAITRLQNYWRETISNHEVIVIYVEEACKANRFLG